MFTTEKLGPDQYVVSCSCGRSWTGHTRGKTEAKAAAHALGLNRALCPHPEKKAYPTRQAVLKGKARTWKISPDGDPRLRREGHGRAGTKMERGAGQRRRTRPRVRRICQIARFWATRPGTTLPVASEGGRLIDAAVDEALPGAAPDGQNDRLDRR